MAAIPDKPALEGLEAAWDARWSEQGTYLFDRDRARQVGRDGIYSVDTPPPTLGEQQRTVLREGLRRRLPVADDGSVHLTARAWAVRGRRP